MTIEKRLPFGFRGDWGKLYKRFTSKSEISKTNDVICYENNNYVDIGQDVQFKRAGDTESGTGQSAGALYDESYTTAETTDAYFNAGRHEYVCVCAPGDIVRVFGRLWIITSVRTVSRYTPKEQKFFYLELKAIL